jgi:transposase-like protein
LVDVYLSDTKNQDAAEEFFTQCRDLSGFDPEMVTTDKEAALYPAMNEVFGDRTVHRDVKYMNNRIEQDHRGIKSRYRVMKGCKNEFSALRFLGSFEEIRQLFNMKKKTRANRRELLPIKIKQYFDLWVSAA